MKILNLLASGLVFATAACGPLGFEAEVFDKEPFTAPPLYEAWWSRTEACSRLSGTLSAITWHLASGIIGDGKVARGRWSPPHEIIIVRGYEDDEPTVRQVRKAEDLGMSAASFAAQASGPEGRGARVAPSRSARGGSRAGRLVAWMRSRRRLVE